MSLPRLDFYALTHNVATWPWPGKALLACALAGLLLVVGDAWLLSPSRERLRVLETRETALQQQLAQRADLAAGLEVRAQQFSAMEHKAAAVLGAIPGQPEVPGLLEDITRLAASNGLVVEGITVLDEQPRAFLIEQPVQIGASGAYHDLAMFVAALGGLSRIVTVHDVALRPDGALLHLELLARAYRGESRGERSLDSEASLAYDSSARRDPFLPPASQNDWISGQPALAPDPARSRGKLEGLATDQFEMVGTLSRGGQVFALLRAASEVYRLAVGDYLGQNHGRVRAIHEGHIELVELFPDGQGAWLERPRTLKLNVNS
ncbi:pilus assembly protein PilP [Pseudomonas palleroniana]|uniref:Pilus assembly protein n=1 Tax=Pseudomonas palleroniana TaxID=191390 RepID=A0A0X7K341_9PSED|nr:pilus assembly protein PilP [Pseudomonas palleroniana]KWU50093.1 pilus assembly protein [Pseudomonas palleroniana]